MIHNTVIWGVWDGGFLLGHRRDSGGLLGREVGVLTHVLGDVEEAATLLAQPFPVCTPVRFVIYRWIATATQE